MDSNEHFGADADVHSKTYGIRGRVVLVAVIVMFMGVLFNAGLKICACCYSQRSLGLAQPRLSRRRRLVVATDQDMAMLQRRSRRSNVVLVYRGENHKDKGLQCAICLRNLEEKEKARRLPNCNHTFHIDCIDTWLDSHSTCPLSRSSIQPCSVAVAAVEETSGMAGMKKRPKKVFSHIRERKCGGHSGKESRIVFLLRRSSEAISPGGQSSVKSSTSSLRSVESGWLCSN